MRLAGFPARSRCRHRLQARLIWQDGRYEAVLGEVRRSDMMRGIWSSCVSASPYAEGVDFEEAVDSAIELARLSELDDLD